MKVSIKKGLSYGTTSGVITSLGLLIGLYSATSSKGVMLAGLLTIAFADSFSDGLGMHVSQESENHYSSRTIWEATISTVFAKMVLGLSFVIPLLLLPLKTAVIADIVWGILALTILSYKIAKHNKEKVSSVLFEHVGLAIVVVVGSLAIGNIIKSYIG